MPPQRVTGIMDGRVTPIGEEPPPFSSVGTNWAGFLIEGHLVEASREEIGWAWHSTHVGVCTGGESELRFDGAAANKTYVAKPGSVTVIPAGTDYTTIHHSGGGLRFLVCELDPATLGRLLHGDDPESKARLLPQIDVRDAQFETLLHSMRLEIEAGCPTGALYAESLSLALVAYVAGRYAVNETSSESREPKLSVPQRACVLEYVHAHIGADFSLIEMASVVSLSPRHFSRLFRNTLGNTPHRYVAEMRIARAKELLATRRVSIAEIASMLGFADQSHFTAVFRKAAGVSPKRYQRQF